MRPRPLLPGHPAVPVALAVAAVAALALLLLLVPVRNPDDRETGPPLGAVLDDADRRALDAEPVRRGPPAGVADPGVDLTDPAAVARAYLVAARSGDADDRGRTRLRAAGYAEPGSPPAAVGVVVLDPPPVGQARTAAVTALAAVNSDEAGGRRGYRAAVTTATGPPGGPAVSASTTAFVVLDRQPDGRWLVSADLTAEPTGSEGDD